MNRRTARIEPPGETRYVFAADDFAANVDGGRRRAARGQRFATDDPLVIAQPSFFRSFTPPPLED